MTSAPLVSSPSFCVVAIKTNEVVSRFPLTSLLTTRVASSNERMVPEAILVAEDKLTDCAQTFSGIIQHSPSTIVVDLFITAPLSDVLRDIKSAGLVLNSTYARVT